tara:strand:- start:1118 stop:1348 length:231 start_codon:yes stop_codon:yes gene_type:complete
MEDDLINNPPHYQGDKLEALDSIRAMLGAKVFISYCLGNVSKYVWRCTKKGNFEQDLQKAKFYIDKAIEENDKIKK